MLRQKLGSNSRLSFGRIHAKSNKVKWCFQVIENFCDMHVRLNKYATSVLTILNCMMMHPHNYYTCAFKKSIDARILSIFCRFVIGFVVFLITCCFAYLITLITCCFPYGK
jgi:hypothetical protein